MDWIDRSTWKPLYRQSNVGSRQNSPVRTIVDGGTVLTLTQKARLHQVWAHLHQIDRDYQRGGFSPYMRHARR